VLNNLISNSQSAFLFKTLTKNKWRVLALSQSNASIFGRLANQESVILPSLERKLSKNALRLGQQKNQQSVILPSICYKMVKNKTNHVISVKPSERPQMFPLQNVTVSKNHFHKIGYFKKNSPRENKNIIE